MNGIGAWLRQLGSKMTAGVRTFMTGRYGMDKLNWTVLWACVIMSLLANFIPAAAVRLVLTVLSYAGTIWVIVRCYSRNTYKRYQENRKYLMLLERLKDREHRYFTCPKCRQSVRVPRGKGKIAITCPKCREKFIKKT